MRLSQRLFEALVQECGGFRFSAGVLIEHLGCGDSMDMLNASARAKRLAGLCNRAERLEARREWLECMRESQGCSAEREEQEDWDEQHMDYYRAIGAL